MQACRVLLALVLVVHATAISDEWSSVSLANEGDVWPLTDAQELLQTEGMLHKENDARQAQYAADAEKAHVAKQEMERTVQTAEAKFKAADSKAQAATSTALETASSDDADIAVTAKQSAAAARQDHVKSKAEYLTTQEKADAAFQKAKDAGADVNLQTIPTPPPVLPAPAPQAQTPPPPLQVQPTKLETTLKARRLKRLTTEAHTLKEKYEEAKVEKEETGLALTKAMAELTKVQTKIAEAKSAKSAAQKAQEQTEKKILQGHIQEHLAHHEMKDAKHEANLSKSMVDEANVEEEVASSLADTGGGLEDLEKSEEKREEVDDRLKNAKATVVALKLASEKSKAAAEAASGAWEEKKEVVEALRKVLTKADGRYAEAKYEINEVEHKEMREAEYKTQAEAEDQVAIKTLYAAHALATAAALKFSAAANADEVQMKALLGDPEEAKKEAIARVKDQDGISQDGNSLIAEDGSIEKAFIKRYNEMPLSDSGANPILEAEARAQLKDDKEGEATAAASAPGPAETAAATSNGLTPIND